MSARKIANVPMTGLTPPTEAEITKILAILAARPDEPVFVHCRRGADRTGAVIAAYHAERRQAHKMGSFQFPRQSYIKNFRPRAVDAAVTSVAGATPAVPPVGAISAAAADKR